MTMWDFAGRTVLITGASGGIGSATAELFASAGANLVLIDRDAAALQTLLSSSGLTSARALISATDVTSMSQCVSAVEKATRYFGKIDVVVPSAGIYRNEIFATMTPEQWQITMSVNLDGVFNIVRSTLPTMGGGGSFVMLSSRAGHSGGSLGHAHYGATKGAILALVRGLARELGPNIRVNAVSPGVIETPMTSEALLTTGEHILKQTPLGRFGTARDVASAIAFLASDQATFVTGETIQVNGGIYMS